MIIENQIIITKRWKGNSTGSIVILIPKKIVEKTNLSNSSYVTVQGASDGIVTIKKNRFGGIYPIDCNYPKTYRYLNRNSSNRLSMIR